MASDVMAVRLHLPQVRVLGVVEDTPSVLVVSVESTFRRLRRPQPERDAEQRRRTPVAAWTGEPYQPRAAAMAA